MKKTGEKSGKLFKNITIGGIFALQGAVIIYTWSSVFSKISSNYDVMTPGFLFFIFLDLLASAVYAVLWQQLIKRYDLSLAYANRGTAVFWSMLWAAILFRERITISNIVGVIIVFCGVMLVNSDET